MFGIGQDDGPIEDAEEYAGSFMQYLKQVADNTAVIASETAGSIPYLGEPEEMGYWSLAGDNNAYYRRSLPVGTTIFNFKSGEMWWRNQDTVLATIPTTEEFGHPALFDKDLMRSLWVMADQDCRVKVGGEYHLLKASVPMGFRGQPFEKLEFATSTSVDVVGSVGTRPRPVSEIGGQVESLSRMGYLSESGAFDWQGIPFIGNQLVYIWENPNALDNPEGSAATTFGKDRLFTGTLGRLSLRARNKSTSAGSADIRLQSKNAREGEWRTISGSTQSVATGENATIHVNGDYWRMMRVQAQSDSAVEMTFELGGGD